MIKKFILIAVFCVFANASLNEKIQNILGNTDYNTHKNLINHLFNNQDAFYTNGKINYARISQELENNNLLKLSLGSTQNIDITFNVNGNMKKSIKNLNDILKVLGHQYFITKDATVVDDTFKWTIKMKTASAISPLRLSQELQGINCNILDIKREGDSKWNY